MCAAVNLSAARILLIAWGLAFAAFPVQALELPLDCESALLERDWDKPSLAITANRGRHSEGVKRQWERWRFQQWRAVARQVHQYENRAQQEVLLLEHYSRAEAALIGELLTLSSARERVEVGGWRVTLKDGRVVMSALTSSLKDQIADTDAWPAFLAALTRAGAKPEDVAIVQFFHTHAESPILSPGDGHYVDVVRERLREARFEAPVHIYSILLVECQVVTGHRSLQ